MKLTWKYVFAWALTAAVIETGCGYLHDQKIQAESAYLAEQLACVDKSATKEESQACRQAVREKWAIQDAQAARTSAPPPASPR